MGSGWGQQGTVMPETQGKHESGLSCLRLSSFCQAELLGSSHWGWKWDPRETQHHHASTMKHWLLVGEIPQSGTTLFDHHDLESGPI